MIDAQGLPDSRPFDRRHFVLVGSTVCGSLLAPLALAQTGGVLARDPIRVLRERNWPVLVAFVEAQLACFSPERRILRPEDVARDLIDFMTHTDPRVQRGIAGALTLLNVFAVREVGSRFQDMSIASRMAALNQGETLGRAVTIRWDDDFLLHTAVSSLSMLTRMSILSTETAQALVGTAWSKGCENPRNHARVSEPEYPDLDADYDLCVIGSGAGGAVVAARAAEAGLKVLIVEEGAWVSPDALPSRQLDAAGRQVAMPPPARQSLISLFRGAGLQLSGNLNEQLSGAPDLADAAARRRLRPVQSVGLAQARVVGGGPYINNAIHLRMRRETWSRWQPFFPQDIDFATLSRRMEQVERDLGVNTEASLRGASTRSLVFAHGADLAGYRVEAAPVSIIPGGLACGSDNTVDPVGEHTGGLHPVRQGGPNSYLMRALSALTPARVAHGLKAQKLEISRNAAGTLSVSQLLVEDRRGAAPNVGAPLRRLRARRFVLSAGAIASTKLLRDSVAGSGVTLPGLGERFTANVGGPVYAVYDQPIYRDGDERPEPGITQCFFIDKARHSGPGAPFEEPTLENWFHFPGTLAMGLTGWFSEWVKATRKYRHVTACAMLVPTKVRPENRIDEQGFARLELDGDELEQLLRGIEKIGRIFLAAATPTNGVALHLPTKAVLLDASGRPAEIRSAAMLAWAINEVRRRGPAFLNLVTSHLQGGNPLGLTVSPTTFRVRTAGHGELSNLHLADASLFPEGCEVNPQLTIKALAQMAADSILNSERI